jgi:hypothetical protein
MNTPNCSLFIILAFRYGGHSYTFPIGVFRSRETAEKAARDHHIYRGGKYDHRIYEFPLDRWDDDIGHAGNNAPCIEANFIYCDIPELFNKELDLENSIEPIKRDSFFKQKK